MAFVKDLYNDEIRDGWLVKSDMKKVWNKQMEIWQEIDNICRKHKITYWAGWGTLLGAVRHGGFIPWDEDFDLAMMRPDYNRFCKIIDDELFQRSGIFEVERKNFSVVKIAHSQTTLLALENINNKQKPKGLAIDIFPLDVTFDGTNSSFFALNAINELLGTVYNYPALVRHVQQGGKTVNDWSVIEELNAFKNLYDKFEFLNIYAEGLFDYSSKVDWIERFVFKRPQVFMEKSWYRKTIYLPFETVKLPAPIDYEPILTSIYGDWHKYVIDGNKRLGFVHSPDIPYREFLKLANVDFIMNKKASEK